MYTAFLSNRLAQWDKKVIWYDETMVDYLLLAGVELFTESNAEFLAETLEGLKVLLVLVLGLDLGLDTLEDTDSGGEVVDAASGPESGGEDLNGRDEIVGKAVVQVALELEDILDTVEFLLESGRELLVCLILVVTAETLGRGAEGRTVDSESNRGLQAGPGQLRSSEEAGRADGAGRDTEDRDGRHCEGGWNGDAGELTW